MNPKLLNQEQTPPFKNLAFHVQSWQDNNYISSDRDDVLPRSWSHRYILKVIRNTKNLKDTKQTHKKT